MNIFLCWSGAASKAIAIAMQSFLGDTVQALKVFLSTENIGKGSRWRDEISQQLYDCNFGILCLTKDNLESRWILFEAGALSKNIAEGRVTALLAGVKPADVLEPLSQFMHTGIYHDEVLKLVRDINGLLPETSRLESDRLQRLFDRNWPTLEASIGAAMKLPTLEPVPRKTDSMVTEILELVRDLKRDSDLKASAAVSWSIPAQFAPLSSLAGGGLLMPGPTNMPGPEAPFAVKVLDANAAIRTPPSPPERSMRPRKRKSGDST